ncbi:iron-containing alcohol dehydrogenase [Natronomonas halophila]|uniref:iron-containing alcohol dehydrogenase family protein n=1 Tax=Natronomonas halophila TaxID=2747817 RepID=UPI0015B5BEAA|nr:iron-containing alcohol dehydrogenase family protein [Natronomonas halophila]QLD85694.1 iron-containing alcohol dehydrogenase [Natronomonas halophila]
MDFRFEYAPGTIRYGEACVAGLADELDALDAERALVVTGRTVGQSADVMDPVETGLGETHVGTFAETTPEKRLGTAFDGADRVEDVDADALVAVGGGSSLDIAKITAVVAASDQSYDEIRSTFEESGSIAAPEGELLPIAVVPTTLAGADLSMIGGITARNDGLIRGGVYDERLMPDALFYDPELFRTTPHGVLCASAMNGFDKAIETLYANTASPITDGTAVRALAHLGDGLPALGEGDRDDETMHDVVVGTVLAQYGCSRPDGLTLSLIHAFGHGIARGYNVQQGDAHSIIAPHALRYLFEEVDGSRELLAEGLGVEAATPEGMAEGIVESVIEVRDALGLSTQLREISDMDESDLPDIAQNVHDDGLMPYCPEGLNPTVDELEGVLREAW